MGNYKPQTAKCHVTMTLRSRLQFVVHVWTAGGASGGKWYTGRFFATKNCTASRLKVWTSLLYPFAMCLLDFWSRINELLLIFERLKEEYPVTAHAPNFDFWTGCRKIKRCEESKRILKNPFASRLAGFLSLIHIWRCRRIERCRSRWSPYH